MLTLEKLLNGRSIVDLSGKEAALAVDLIKEALESKPIEEFTEVEYRALIEELIVLLGIIMFRDGIPDDPLQEMLNRLENSPQRKWGWEWASVLDVFLSGVELWDMIDPEDAGTLAKDIINYLREAV